MIEVAPTRCSRRRRRAAVPRTLQDGVVEALRGLAVGDADRRRGRTRRRAYPAAPFIRYATSGSRSLGRDPLREVARASCRLPAVGDDPRPAPRSTRARSRAYLPCSESARSGPIAAAGVRGRERVAASRSPARRSTAAVRGRVAAGGAAARRAAWPPPAKAAIVIAAPAQARPPAARMVALTPPAAGGCRRAGAAPSSSAAAASSSAMPGDQPAAGSARRRRVARRGARGAADLHGRVRVRLSADEPVVDLVGPPARRSGTTTAARYTPGLAGRRGGEGLRRVAAADRHRRLDVAQRRPPVLEHGDVHVPRLPRRRPGGRRAQPDGRPPTRQRGGSERHSSNPTASSTRRTGRLLSSNTPLHRPSIVRGSVQTSNAADVQGD